MKRILIALLLIPVVGCSSSGEQKEPPKIIGSNSDEFTLMKIGNCQYFRVGAWGPYFSYFHKGDCNNPVHVYNKVGK